MTLIPTSGLGHTRIWVFVDSNQRLSHPAPVFRARGSFVVEAVPIRRPRFEWAKNVFSERF